MIRNLLVFCLAAASSSAWAADGLLDMSFGIFSTGRNVLALDQGGSNSDTLADVLVAADGSIFLVGTAFGPGSASRYSITHLTANGLLDSEFGANGTVYSVPANVMARRAQLDAAGNIVVVGEQKFVGTDRDFHLCRFNQQGLTVPFPGILSSCTSIAFDSVGGNLTDSPRDFIIEPNGKIVIAGIAGFSGTNDSAALARLSADGTPDASFGNTSNGKIKLSPAPGKINRFNAIARRPDGKFIAVGEYGDSATQNGTTVLFARLTGIGTLDPTFQAGVGFGGYAINQGDPFNRDDAATAIHLLPNGKILMAGIAKSGSSSVEEIEFVYRILPADVINVDSPFGNNGSVLIGSGHSLELGDMLVQSDGKIVLLGTRRPTAAMALEMYVVRLNADGAVDFGGFGTGGRTIIDFLLPGELDFGVRAASQFGHIIAAGHSLRSAPDNLDQTVARLGNDLIFADGLD